MARDIKQFLRGFVRRDRYLLEALAAVVTFGLGVLASVSQDTLASRQALSGFRDMPHPEYVVLAFTVPGIWSAVKIWHEGESYEGKVSLSVMLSFVILCFVSLLADLDNWGFWALFALLLGVMKGFAVVSEWSYLRWSTAVLGAFFWISLTASIVANTRGDIPLAVSPFAGFAAANLLSVWRARGCRNA